MPLKDRRLYPKAYEGIALPEYGREANVLKSKTFDLGVARTLHRVEIGGNVLWTMQATSRTAYIDIYLNDQQRDPIRFQLGLFIRGTPFSRIFVSNPAQAGETITLFYAVEEVDNIQIENPALQFTEIDVTKSTAFQALADIVIAAPANGTEILPANANRRTAIIGNLAGQATTMRIGPHGVGAAIGAELAPGESISLDTTQAIHGFEATAAGELVTRVWTED